MSARPTFPYNGLPRYQYLRSGQRVHRGQRMFAVPDAVRLNALYWTREDQAWAVSQGFFVSRVQPTNHVRLVSLRTPKSEGELSDWLSQELFRNPASKHLQKTLSFIEQQDRLGWSNTWETLSIETPRTKMRWLADMRHQRGTIAGRISKEDRQRVYDHVRADANRASRDELGLETRELRRIFTPGCPCTYCKALERRPTAEAA